MDMVIVDWVDENVTCDVILWSRYEDAFFATWEIFALCDAIKTYNIVSDCDGFVIFDWWREMVYYHFLFLCLYTYYHISLGINANESGY